MDLTEIKEIINNEEIFNHFVNEFQVIQCKKGEILLNEGEPQTFAIIINKGVIRRFKTIEKKGKSKEIEIERLTEGKIVGFYHLISEEHAFASLQVETETAEISRISSKQFLEIVKDPSFSIPWLQILAKQIRKQSKIIRALTPKDEDENDTRIKVAFFDSTSWTKLAFDKPEFREAFNMRFYEQRLESTTVNLAAGFKVISCFVNDCLNAEVLNRLNQLGIRMISMRCAGFDRLDINVAISNQMTVTRVPQYSPYAVAEHAVGLLLTLNRKIHRSYNRTRDGNFSIDGLVGFDLHGKTMGVIGTGKIGYCLVQILLGFGCKVLCYDIYPNQALSQTPNVKYVELDELYPHSDAIFLMAPLTPQTKHMISKSAIDKMKDGVILVNTSRGGLVNTCDLIQGLKSHKIQAAGLDVYENESNYFFCDHSSDSTIDDEELRCLMSMHNVVITSHQAFLTLEAINNIAHTSIENITLWSQGTTCSDHPNSVY